MAVSLPSRARFPAPHFSPLKPHISRSTSIKCSGATTTSTKVHLANLDRVLLKPSTLLPLQQPVSPIHLQHNDHVPPSSDRRMIMASVFPDLFRKVTAEDMISPGSLKRLHRLLSDSARPSPRSCIADTWRELHGAKGWSGLLDPLDEHLRRELVRYGELVQAAYHAFHSIPSPRSSSSRHRHLILPDRSYRPTKSLFASSSLDLPQWAPRSLAERSSWIGYVAVCDCDREIRRMGRRDIAIVLRGTATCIEWAENLRPSLVPLDPVQPCLRGAPKVAQGFLSLFQTAGEHVPSLAEGVVQEVRRLMKVYEGEEISITITGHSLGAALAVLVADELSGKLGSAVPSIAVISFGGPKVGNGAFAERVMRRGVNVLRVVNSGDVITRVPAAPALPHVSEGYEHVGSELRVDNRNSPYLKPGAGPDCCHDLEAYLHLVDGFSKSGFGFRPDAKRSLVRLLELQQPNVKKVYARQAHIIRSNRANISLPERSTEPCGVHLVNSVEPDRLILTNIKISR